MQNTYSKILKIILWFTNIQKKQEIVKTPQMQMSNSQIQISNGRLQISNYFYGLSNDR